MRQGDVVYYIHADHLGSVSVVSDESGVLLAVQRYYPYGESRHATGTLPTDFGFTGQRVEAGLGLLDYRARFYAPMLGRFISADTIVPEPGNPQALNRYSYVYNRPLVYVDPSGHFGDEELLKYGVFYGPNQLGGCRDGEYGCAAWYWALRAADEGDWLEGWGSVHNEFTIGNSIEYRGQFSVVQERLLFTTTSDEQYQVFYGGLRSLENADKYISVNRPILEKPDGTRLGTTESLRRYAMLREFGDHSSLHDVDFYELDVGFYAIVGGNVSLVYDRYGHLYVGLNVGIGISGPDLSLTAGHLNQDYVPDESQLSRILEGLGLAVEGGALAGGGLSISESGPIAVQYGATGIGASTTIGYAWRLR
ncbi:MAG: RHS repeat-associated core domain-containing protein [Anaerolineae bacterium]|nr:RHS repeat-associated core domain-containing protein [Anaerolineae bacterium]